MQNPQRTTGSSWEGFPPPIGPAWVDRSATVTIPDFIWQAVAIFAFGAGAAVICRVPLSRQSAVSFQPLLKGDTHLRVAFNHNCA